MTVTSASYSYLYLFEIVDKFQSKLLKFKVGYVCFVKMFFKYGYGISEDMKRGHV